jgi:hypothetical protein
MTGALDMNLCNISNVGTETFSTAVFPSSTDFLTINASLSSIAPNITTWIDSAFTSSISSTGTTLNRVTSRAVAATVFNPCGGGTVTYGNRTLNSIPIISGITRSSFLRSATGIAAAAGTKGFFAVISLSNYTSLTYLHTSTAAAGLNVAIPGSTQQLYVGAAGVRNNIITNGISSFLANSNVIISAINSYPTLSNVVTANGSEVGLPTPNTTGNLQGNNYLSGTGTISIGEGSDAGATITVAELIVYDNTEITTTQRQLIEGYLAWKWGLQAQLPPSHPYASGAPYGNPQTSSFGSMSINSGSNVQISATSNIVLQPGTGCNVTVSGALTATGTTTLSALVVTNNVTVSSGGFSVPVGTTTLSALVVSNATSMTGNLNMNLCNITNLGTEAFSFLIPGVAPVTFSVATPASTVCGSYTYFTCTTSCTITPQANVSAFYFAVGGGGGGGGGQVPHGGGGGGGAGGLQTNIAGVTACAAQFNSAASAGITLTSGSNYTLVIGNGGSGGGNLAASGVNGTATIFSGFGITTITASGGGAAGTGGGNPGIAGGSGGGGGSVIAGSGTPAGGVGTQGFNGVIGGNQTNSGGGGGGIGSEGISGLGTGVGGSAITFPIVGNAYGGGGGAGRNGTGALGGGGGAGNGGANASSSGGNATENSGSGGGGGGKDTTSGGRGGSGIFILAVFNSALISSAGSITTNASSNLQISATSNIILNPSSGGNVTVSSGGFNVPAGTTTLSSLVVTNNASFTGTNTVSALVVTNNVTVSRGGFSVPVGTTTLSSLVVSNSVSLQGVTTLSSLTVTNNATVLGNLIFPTVNVFTVSATSLTLTTASAGFYYYLSNSGFSNITLPLSVPTVAGLFWTLRNATGSYLSATVQNSPNAISPLVLSPSNNTTLVYSVSGTNNATICGYIVF